MVVYLDADACPVKEETFRVAKRYNLKVYAVSNVPLFLPRAEWILPVVTGKDFDAVDNWIADHVEKRDLVITNDILLAERCVRKEAVAINPRGGIYDENNIGEAVSMRELMSELRQRGAMDLGPKKMGKNHKSNFLAALDQVINKLLRASA